MEKTEIVVGEDYAYLIPGMAQHQPLRAVVNSEPESGYVEVTIYHPDVGQSEERVKTRELVGAWNDEPQGKSQYDRQLAAAHERGEKLTWATIAEQRYAFVQRQRALAAWLGTVGIPRASRHYAGKGGTSVKPHDVDLQLNYDELEHLRDIIERGRGAVVPPWVNDPDPTLVPDQEISA